MPNHIPTLRAAQPGDHLHGFVLSRKERLAARAADAYLLRHEKTGAELLYLDRAAENKTFAICFKTLPEDDTGVFHILEHSVLNGSEKYPVREPFVSLLQSSMQTYLNAMTFSDKTVYPVSSRNEQDFFNLMSVYLDAVFRPLIHTRKEIFLQEGWHYEFGEDGRPCCNGVVYSEMKGAYADVDTLLDDEMNRLLYPDTCYGFSSGGHPAHIPELSYERFTAAHKRFYHPSNARIFLDGAMDIDAVLSYLDGEYLSQYDYRAPDFDFTVQQPRTAEKTVTYEAREGELSHLVTAKIYASYGDKERICAARILADYLTGSNEAPLTRAFLERGLSQDVSLAVDGGILQPSAGLIVRNTEPEKFAEIKAFLPEFTETLCRTGLDRDALLASLVRAAFFDREITEPYGIELAIQSLQSWLYGGDPLMWLDNTAVFASLREKADTSYFTDLLRDLLGGTDDKCWLYVLPSQTKGAEDAAREDARLAAVTADWTEADYASHRAEREALLRWQQTPDTEEALAALPHLRLEDVPQETEPTKTRLTTLAGREVLEVQTETNGIVYLHLYFDLSDFSLEELRLLNVLTDCFGELRTEHYAADRLQSRIKAVFGSLRASLILSGRTGDLSACTPHLKITAGMLEEHTDAALGLLRELLLCGRYDETERIRETVLQADYFQKQSRISDGHQLAISRALAPYSRVNALKELALDGEHFVDWYSDFAAKFEADAAAYPARFAALTARAFAKNRLFAGYGGSLAPAALESLIEALPEQPVGAKADYPAIERGDCALDIPAEVGFSALGANLYAAGGEYTGDWAVLSTMMTYAYLWGQVRVQGGAYGTGMSVRANGDLFCYSYRDPNLANTADAFGGMPEFLDAFLAEGAPLDDLIIGTVNTTDPLLSPRGVCGLACLRHLGGTKPEDIARIRREILCTTPETLAAHRDLLRRCLDSASFCAVGNAEATAFVRKA